MNKFEINTTAWSEENFMLETDLTEQQVIDVILPIVVAERNGGEEYDNEMLYNELASTYQNASIQYGIEINLITI
jgi:hypothetical protein